MDGSQSKSVHAVPARARSWARCSFAMPLIRYRLGDVATRGPDRCTSGAPFSTIRGIQGRMHDWFVLPGDG